MALESFQAFSYIAINIFVIFCFVFALKTFSIIRRQRKEPAVKEMLSKVFLLFAIGIALWSVSELGWDIWTRLAGSLPPAVSWLDTFWICGYFFIIPAFAYFNIFMLEKHENQKKGLTVLAAAAILIAVFTYFVMARFAIPAIGGSDPLQLFVYLFYSIGSGIMVVLSVSVYTFFKEVEAISKPLVLLAIGAGATYFGDMLYAHYLLNNVYGWSGVFSDLFYAIGYGTWALALYLFSSRKWAQ
ncbi:MAG: hypothetical protein KJ574_05290 [Nanoarchaeota archaeon]|nr:hypothetical protein [Nanoarchaeota archaeon]